MRKTYSIEYKYEKIDTVYKDSDIFDAKKLNMNIKIE